MATKNRGLDALTVKIANVTIMTCNLHHLIDTFFVLMAAVLADKNSVLQKYACCVQRFHLCRFTHEK